MSFDISYKSLMLCFLDYLSISNNINLIKLKDKKTNFEIKTHSNRNSSHKIVFKILILLFYETNSRLNL